VTSNILLNQNCPICGNDLTVISRKNFIYPNDGHGWENDSTMELINLTKANVFAGFCNKCFHAIRLPKFDTSKIYGSKATKVRAKHFSIYFPNKSYGEPPTKINAGEAFLRANRENKKFGFISKKISSFLKTNHFNENTIKILDWGGGDGSVSDQYQSILTNVTGCQIDSWVFDYAPWKHGESKKRLNSKNIANQAPFDIIILSHVLEHTDDPVKMISDINQVLNIGGILILEVPDERMNIVRSLFGKKITLHYHVAWYSRRSLSVLLNRCGLIRSRVYYHFRSSYHGLPMTTILAIAQKQSGNIKAQVISPIIMETFSLIIFTIKKVISKFIHSLKKG